MKIPSSILLTLAFLPIIFARDCSVYSTCETCTNSTLGCVWCTSSSLCQYAESCSGNVTYVPDSCADLGLQDLWWIMLVVLGGSFLLVIPIAILAYHCRLREEIFECPITLSLLPDNQMGHSSVSCYSSWRDQDFERQFCCGLKYLEVHESPTVLSVASYNTPMVLALAITGLFVGVFLCSLYIGLGLEQIWWIGVAFAGFFWITSLVLKTERSAIIDKATGNIFTRLRFTIFNCVFSDNVYNLNELKRVRIFRIHSRRSVTVEVELHFHSGHNFIVLQESNAAQAWRVFQKLHKFIHGNEFTNVGILAPMASEAYETQESYRLRKITNPPVNNIPNVYYQPPTIQNQ